MRRKRSVEVIGGGTFDRVIAHQEVVDDKLGEAFVQWLDEPYVVLQGKDTIIQSTDRNHKTSRSLTILTIDPSYTVIAALIQALSALSNLSVHLSIISSSDNTAVLTLLATFPPSLRDRLHVTTYLPSAIGTASQVIDILLSKAMCIDEHGCIRGATSALGTAVCVKMLSPEATIVAVAHVDSIGPGVVQEREAGVVQGSFEWVSAQFVDVYVTEAGVLEADSFDMLAKEADELVQYIFQEDGHGWT